MNRKNIFDFAKGVVRPANFRDRPSVQRVIRKPPAKVVPLRTMTFPPRPNPAKLKSDASILIWINTFNRPDNLQALLGHIYKNKEDYNIQVLLFDDCSSKDYTEILASYQNKLKIEYIRSKINHGKRGYWKLCTYAMGYIGKNFPSFDYYMKLDDDLILINRFFKRCINIWESIDDNLKICLNFRLDSREGKCVWTNTLPIICRFGDLSVYRSQWVDMDFFATFSFFEELQFYISEQPESRWRYRPTTSSGVGRDISIRLHRMGYHLYLTKESLVTHGLHDSFMNPHEREQTPLVTKSLRDANYGLKINGR